MPSSLPPPRALPFPAAPAAGFRARPGMAGLGLRAPHRPPRLGPLARARAASSSAAATPGFGSPRGVDMAPEGAGPHRPSRPIPIPRRQAAPSPHRSPEASPASQAPLRFAPVAGAAEGSPGRGVCDGAGVG